MKLVTTLLFCVSVFLSLKHGWDALRQQDPQQAKIMAELGISKSIVPFIGILSIATGLLLLFPNTFFISNIMNAAVILLIMAFALKAGNVRMALIEIPFLALPLLLIWLKYPYPLRNIRF